MKKEKKVSFDMKITKILFNFKNEKELLGSDFILINYENKPVQTRMTNVFLGLKKD